jgi:hypothetical protein
LTLSKFSPVFLFLLWLSHSSFAQIEKGYYLFPIKPGERNFLAGNMSEIRPNHFHTGLDIKTDQRQGLPVYAAADGFVQRMKISSFGYGNILYLRHPNGQITVYAHLREFAPEIAAYIRQEMYKEQKNELEIYLDESTLPVKKGDVIAYSGNTGSSAGPHLHFEIRDSLDRAIDPLKFGFSEIIDKTPPTITKVAISPLTIDSRINGQYARREYNVHYDGTGFYVKEPIEISGKVGIELRGFDKLDDMYNPNGFPMFKLYEEDSLTFSINVDLVDFELGRFLLSHTYRNSFTRLYKNHNNQFHFYQPDEPLSGSIEAVPDQEKAVSVLIKDVYDNATQLRLNFVGREPQSKLMGNNTTGGSDTFVYDRNIMIVNASPSDRGTLAQFYINGYAMEIPMAYEGNNKRTYLWDLDFGVPDSIDVCTEVLIPGVKSRIPFQEKSWFSDGKTTINFDDKSLLDDLYLRIADLGQPGMPSIRVNDPSEYLRSGIEITMDAAGYEGNKEKTQVYLEYANGYKRFLGGEWEDHRIRFSTSNLGTFVLTEDSIPPRIKPIRVTPNELSFTISDNLSGINSFEAFVDGEWILMRYEYKQALIWSEKLENKPFKGEVVLKVRDNAGNEALYQRRL